MFVYNMDRKPIKNTYKTVILGDSSVSLPLVQIYHWRF